MELNAVLPHDAAASRRYFAALISNFPFALKGSLRGEIKFGQMEATPDIIERLRLAENVAATLLCVTSVPVVTPPASASEHREVGAAMRRWTDGGAGTVGVVRVLDKINGTLADLEPDNPIDDRAHVVYRLDRPNALA